MNEDFPSYRRIDSETEYRAALLQVIGRAERSLRILDRDLSRMQLERTPAIEFLKGFLRGNGESKIYVALHQIEYLERSAPRLRELFETHSHLVEVRCVPDSLKHLADCHLLADQSHGVRRFHADHSRASVAFDNPQEIAPWWRRFDELWEHCEHCLKNARLCL